MNDITMDDIARECGVSKMLVSAILNKNKKSTVRYSEKTAKKVRKSAKALGNHPNLLARSLSRKRTDTIGMVVTIKNDGIAYLTESCIGIIETATEKGYRVLAVNLYSKIDPAKEIDSLLESQVEGIITLPNISLNKGEIKKQILDSRVPWVSCFQDIRGIDGVLPDIMECSKLGTEYLISRKYKKIALVLDGGGKIGKDAEKGYRNILEKHNIEFYDELIFRMGHSVQAGKEAMDKILKLKETPDTVFFTADVLAIGAIRVIFKSGLTVPEDIAVLGWDNLQAALDFSDIPLSTIEPGKYEAGKCACELLINKIKSNKKKAKTKKILFDPKLVLRASV